MHVPGQAELPGSASTLMIVHQPCMWNANDAIAGLPNAGADINILHIEEITFVHSSDFGEHVSTDKKTAPQHPFSFKRLSARPAADHKMVIDHLLEGPIRTKGRAAAHYIEHTVKSARRILPAAVRIDHIQPYNSNLWVRCLDLKGLVGAPVFEIGVRVENQ